MSSILDDDPIEDVNTFIDHEQKPITQSNTNSKVVQEQINRAQTKGEASKVYLPFRNNSGVELAENEPAYKRQGVELNDIQHSSRDIIKS